MAALVAGGLVAVPVLLPLRAQLFAWFSVRSGAADGLLSPLTVRLLPDGVHAASARGESLFRWTAIQHVTERAERLFLFVSTRSALIVPRRAFTDEVGFAAFRAEVERRRAAARR